MKKKTLTIGLLAIVLFSVLWVGSQLWASNKSKNVYTSLEVFQRVLQLTRDSYVRDVDLNDMIEDAMNGMLQELDPYSMYMSPEDYENLSISMEGEFGGLGITIGITDGWLTVISPLKGTPADKEGLLAGDWIVEIEGETTEGITTEEAVTKLRGEPGTKVSIAILRHGLDDPIDYTITRDIIKLNAVSHVDKFGEDVGYILFSKFSRTAREEIEQAIDSLFNKEGVSKLILDIRSNSGGYLNEGIDVSDLFLDRDLEIVQTRGRIPQSIRTYRAHEEPMFGEFPMIVLTDRGSASAAEILAGALQDWERAILIGDTTFGKGSVQTIHQLPDSGRLKLTTAYWYTPVGRCIEKWGISEEELEKSQKNFKTLGPRQREIYGGGAITPDIYIEPSLRGELETLFLSRNYNVFFAYAVDYISKNPDIDKDFVVDDAMLDGLAEEARNREVDFTEEQFEAEKEQLAYRLKMEIADQKWGDDARYEVFLSEDPVIEEALTLLNKTEKISELFRFVD